MLCGQEASIQQKKAGYLKADLYKTDPIETKSTAAV
jgi:hypothetical protein